MTSRIRAVAPSLRPAHVLQLRRSSRLTLADSVMIGAMVIWSINITSVKVAVDAIPPLGFGLLRYAVGTCILLLILKWREGTVGVRRADLGWLALGGALGMGINQMAFLVGIHQISASLAAIILATAPLLTAMVAALWAHEPLSRRTLLSLAVSFAGVVVVIAGAGVGIHATLVGGLLILVAAATLALAAICAKWPLRSYTPLRVTTWMCLFGSLMLFPLGLPALLSTERASITSVIVAATIFTILGSTVLANLGWSYAIQQLGAARANAYTYLQPVLGVIFAMIVLGERLVALQYLGGVVVLLGLVVYPRKRAAKRQATAEDEMVAGTPNLD